MAGARVLLYCLLNEGAAPGSFVDEMQSPHDLLLATARHADDPQVGRRATTPSRCRSQPTWLRPRGGRQSTERSYGRSQSGSSRPMRRNTAGRLSDGPGRVVITQTSRMVFETRSSERMEQQSRGRLEAARTALTRATELAPADPATQIGLANVLRSIGRFDEAVAALAAAESLTGKQDQSLCYFRTPGTAAAASPAPEAALLDGV
eukprot:scaffold34270_cov63-Phaeocystis_antarctica.AAC.1